MDGPNRWGPGIPGDTILFGQSAMPRSGNPYHGEFQTETRFNGDRAVNRAGGSRGTLGSPLPFDYATGSAMAVMAVKMAAAVD